jgi:ABC-type nitrate/sulfonate/bicarbonate transport system substrate-binding protein
LVDLVKGFRQLAALAALALIAAGCGGGDDDAGSGAGDGSLSLKQVKLAIDNDDFMNQMAWMIADEMYWPKLGFTEKAEVVATDEYLAGLFGGDVWVAQGESDVIWAALAEGSVPMKIIGVEKDSEAWYLGIRKGVDKNNLKGLKISGGPAGDRNIVVGEKILAELGVDPKSLQWVQVEGGSDDRLAALIAGNLDVAVLQPRHVIPLEKAGGEMIYDEFRPVPQEVWVVKSETMEKNRDAVCAYLEGRIAAKRWASQGKDYMDNQKAAIAVAEKRGLKASEGDLAEWKLEMEGNWSLDGGSSLQSFDDWSQDMINNGNVPKDFKWRVHADFSCLTEVQKKLGITPNPGDT